MKFVCGSCRTKYSIADERVRGRVLTILCRACGARMVVREVVYSGEQGEAVISAILDGAERVAHRERARRTQTAVGAEEHDSFADRVDLTEATEAMVQGGVEAAQIEWYTAAAGKQMGPMPLAELLRRIEAHEVLGAHYAWHDGLDAWKRVRDIPLLKTHLPIRSVRPADQRITEVAGSDAQPPSEPQQVPAPAKQDSERPTLRVAQADDSFGELLQITAAQTAPKHSTRFLMEAAGIRGIRHRNKMALTLGAIAAACFAAFVVCWAFGLVHLDINGIRPPFELQRAEAESGDVAAQPDRSDVERVHRDLEGRASRGRPRPFLARERSSAQDQEHRTPSIEPRGASPERVPILLDGVSIDTNEVGIAKLPELRPGDAPVAGELSARSVKEMITARRTSIATCYDRSLRSDGRAHGRVDLELTIRSSGLVQDVNVLARSRVARQVGACVAEKIKRWRFPPFSGSAPQAVVVPFVFESGLK
jgi:TonB family protein